MDRQKDNSAKVSIGEKKNSFAGTSLSSSNNLSHLCSRSSATSFSVTNIICQAGRHYFFQDWRAEKMAKKLMSLSSTQRKIITNGSNICSSFPNDTRITKTIASFFHHIVEAVRYVDKNVKKTEASNTYLCLAFAFWWISIWDVSTWIRTRALI